MVLPGVVATEFGNNALHGGPDSKAMPGAQPVDEVATAKYYSAEDVSEIEAGFGGPPPR